MKYVIKQRSAFKPNAASWAKDVKVVLGLCRLPDWSVTFADVEASVAKAGVDTAKLAAEFDSSPNGSQVEFNAAGFLG